MYFTDPVTKQPSVSLTFLIVAGIAALGFSIAEALGYVKSVDAITSLFYSCAALYFGRRFSVGGKTFDANKTQPNGENQ